MLRQRSLLQGGKEAQHCLGFFIACSRERTKTTGPLSGGRFFIKMNKIVCSVVFQVYTSKVSTSEKMMLRQRSWQGDLSLATSKPGVVVRCVQLPNQQFHKFWRSLRKANKINYSLLLPEHRQLYIVRANVKSPQGFQSYFAQGVCLSTHPKGLALVNPTFSLGGGLTIEPFFPYSCFDFVSDRP